MKKAIQSLIRNGFPKRGNAYQYTDLVGIRYKLTFYKVWSEPDYWGKCFQLISFGTKGELPPLSLIHNGNKLPKSFVPCKRENIMDENITDTEYPVLEKNGSVAFHGGRIYFKLGGLFLTFITYISNKTIINKFDAVKRYAVVGYHRNSVNIAPSPTAIEIIKNEITAPYAFDRVERIMALRIVDSRMPIDEIKKEILSSMHGTSLYGKKELVLAFILKNLEEMGENPHEILEIGSLKRGSHKKAANINCRKYYSI